MRRLDSFVATSPDDRTAGPGDDVSIFPFDDDHGRALAVDRSDALPTAAFRAAGVAPAGTRWDTVVMGRRTAAEPVPPGWPWQDGDRDHRLPRAVPVAWTGPATPGAPLVA